MEDPKIDPKLCQICGDLATYGDGTTWAKCSKHQYESKEVVVPAQESKEPEGEPHKTVPGLTSIIIPVYNLNYFMFHITGNCIGAIREHTPDLPYEIIIVDNGSAVKHDKEHMSDWLADKVILNEENVGYVKAVNQGIRAAFGEYIAVVCTDVQVFYNWLEDAQEALKHVDLVYAKPMYGMPWARAKEAFKERAKWVDKPIEESLNNDPQDGSCFITTKKLLDEVGLFDERFFNYAADVDLYRRINEAGKKHAGSERIRTHHIIQASAQSIEDNPEIMTADKEAFKAKWDNPEPVAEEAPTLDENTPLVRAPASGDKLYLLYDDTLHWITTPETLTALGYGFGQERIIEDTEYRGMERGEPINMSNVDKYKNA